MDKLELYIEALVFAAPKPIPIKDIRMTVSAYFDQKISQGDIESSLKALEEKYKSEDYSFELIEIANGFQFMTKGTYHPVVSQFLKLESRRRLSKAALETLAIIAYKQPATRSAVEQIRGVNCDYSIQKLLDKELIEILGRDEGPGRPLLYGTTDKFMNHFGLRSIKELPQLKEFEAPENAIGSSEEE